jgi:hypothetical protein
MKSVYKNGVIKAVLRRGGVANAWNDKIIP